MANKNRLLALLQILQNGSDELHPLTTAQVRKELAERGISVSVMTLRDDVAALKESGYEIQVEERNGTPTTYAYLERSWAAPELQILIDAVCSAQFIPTQKSQELIARLISMAGPSYRDTLQPEILISEHIKAKNKNMIYTVQAIQKAIKKDHKISFRYLQYNFEKEQVPRHLGTPEEVYIVSPYATIWNNDRYYLVGFSDSRQKVITYRIDRMNVPRQLSKKRVPAPDDFCVQDYVDKVFWMYKGPEEEVTLRCRNEILDQIIDRFGEGVDFKNRTDTTFDITVPVCISGTFYAWVAQYVGEMRVIEPESIRKGYAEYLQKAVEETLA